MLICKRPGDPGIYRLVSILSDYEVVNPSYEQSDLTLGRKDQNCILSNLPFNLEGD